MFEKNIFRHLDFQRNIKKNILQPIKQNMYKYDNGAECDSRWLSTAIKYKKQALYAG